VSDVLSADWVLPIEGPPIRDGAVAIEDGRIAAVGMRNDLGAGTHYEDAVLIPAFVNAHSHIEYAVYAGFGDGLGDGRGNGVMPGGGVMRGEGFGDGLGDGLGVGLGPGLGVGIIRGGGSGDGPRVGPVAASATPVPPASDSAANAAASAINRWTCRMISASPQAPCAPAPEQGEQVTRNHVEKSPPADPATIRRFGQDPECLG